MNRKNLTTFPQSPGVYLMKNTKGSILYIGKAKNLKSRINQYFITSGDSRAMVPFLTQQVAHIDTIVTFSEQEALLLEHTLIKQYQPKYNILLKDDKTFICLSINHTHTWPMIRIIRHRNAHNHHSKTRLFGPYTSAQAARNILTLMHRIFKLRQCSDKELKSRSRPCILHSINRCLGPCKQLCSHDEYQKEVIACIDFLKGNNQAIIKKLEQDMDIASQDLAFEKAQQIFQTINQIKQITHHRPSTIRSSNTDCDVFGQYTEHNHMMIVQLMYRSGCLTGSDHWKTPLPIPDEQLMWESLLFQNYQPPHHIPNEIIIPIKLDDPQAIKAHLNTLITTPQKGEKLQLVKLAIKNAKALHSTIHSNEERLLDLKEHCHLDKYPMYIECFDTSNTSGSDPVACMVGFREGERDSKATKYFKISTTTTSDDYQAMKEALFRHYQKVLIKGLELPDLLIVDGGKGQLNIALQIFNDLEIANIDVIALSKENSKHSKGLCEEKIFIPHQRDPIMLSPRSPVLLLIQKIRDEAHRVVITYHKSRRSKRLIQTALDEIPGIGPKKRAKLLKAFGSVKGVKNASLEDFNQSFLGLSQANIKALINFQKKSK